MRMLLSAMILAVTVCTACGSPEAASAEEFEGVAVASPDSVVVGDTEAVFLRVMEWARGEDFSLRPFGDVVQRVAEQFLGTPYVEGTLDQGDREVLVLNLEGFDCVLFVEAVLALSRGIVLEDADFASFAARIREQRYRDGILDGYCSRLHYFTDWIRYNEARGLVRDITEGLGGIQERKVLDFMGTHRDSYARLADDSTFACILESERALLGLPHVYIPQDRIAQVYPQIRPGDVIATSTTIRGLDVTHTGFAYRWPDGGIGFVHASSTGEVKVAVDLQAYVQGQRVQRGIVVARPSDPRDIRP